MWIIIGAKTKAKVVEGGRAADGRCDACKADVRFRECDVKDTYRAFFVDLFDTTQRRMVCNTCGEDHDVDEFFKVRAVSGPPSSKALPPKSSGHRPVVEPKRDKRQVDAEIDAELAALKRRIGK